MPQIRGIKGKAVGHGVSSAFPEGKQNDENNIWWKSLYIRFIEIDL